MNLDFREACIKKVSQPSFNICTDQQRNTFVVGGSDLLKNSVSSLGEQDIFIFKLNSSGQVNWARQIGFTAKVAICNGVRIDESNFIYITGVLTGSLGSAVSSLEQAFVAKYTSEGSLQWLRQISHGGQILSNIHDNCMANESVCISREVKVLDQELFIPKVNGIGILQRIRELRIGSGV